MYEVSNIDWMNMLRIAYYPINFIVLYSNNLIAYLWKCRHLPYVCFGCRHCSNGFNV